MYLFASQSQTTSLLIKNAWKKYRSRSTTKSATNQGECSLIFKADHDK